MSDSPRTSADAYTIRRARAGDEDALGGLWKQLLDEQAALDVRLAVADDALARWHNDFAEWLSDETYRHFVAVGANDALVGFVAAVRWGPPPIYREASEVYVNELYVKPEARRRGTGRALVDAVRRWAEEVGAKRLRLRALAANHNGRAFWEREGAAALASTLTIDVAGAAPSQDASDTPTSFGFDQRGAPS